MSRPEAGGRSPRAPRPIIAAASISSTVASFLRQPRRGTVLAVFARSCYLDLDESIVAVVAEELLNGPLNIVLPDPGRSFDQLVARGDVTATPDALFVEGWPAISVREAVPWDPRIRPWSAGQMRGVVINLETLSGRVMVDAPAESLAQPRFEQVLAALRHALRRRSPGEVASAATGLAGLGGGLTPSGDDVLVGALVALAALPGGRSDSLRSAIREGAAGRTTRISEAYLQAAARGEGSEAWQDLLLALASATADDVIRTGRRVMAFGETSGADMLAGFLLAMPALMVAELY
ncbi:MAG TPA: DUF2877 domain-containing protein [bacterium]